MGKLCKTLKFFITEAPKLYLDGLLGKKLKVRAGEPIDIKIPMSGAPTPTVEWSKGPKKIEPSKRTSVRFRYFMYTVSISLFNTCFIRTLYCQLACM